MDPENRLDELLTHYKLPIAIGLVGLVLLVGGIITSGIIPKTFKSNDSQVAFVKSSKSFATDQPSSAVIKVDVSGAVASPGVYNLPQGARVEEAIKAAGGVTASADPIYVSKSLNLAQKISDGMKIYIPKTDEGQSSGVIAGSSTESVNKLVNINTATLADLDKLPGVGETTAQKIVDKRPYTGIEELLTKKAVSRSTYDKIKSMVSVY